MASQEIAHRTPMQEVLAEVASDNFIAKLGNALPEKVSPQRFVSVTVTAIKTNPALIAADRDTLYNSIVRCAQDGLMPDNREAALVIFRVKGVDKVQYLPMIGGLRKRLAEHGFDLTAHVVYENDAFDYQLGDDPWVKHKPARLGSDRGTPIGAYAVAEDVRTRKKYLDVMDVPQIEQVRAVSRAATSEYGPWVKWWDEQARKTVGRRLAKTLPLADPEVMAKLLAAIDDEYDLPNPDGGTMTEAEANAAASASTSGVPIGDRQQLRDEPLTPGPSDAQLNRVAELQAGVEERLWRATLRGVFGAGDVSELSPEDADRYEHTLREYVGSAEEIQDGELVSEEEAGQGSFEDMVPDDVKRQRESA